MNKMEKTKSIPTKDFSKGFFIELDCCMCGHKETIGATTQKELKDILNDLGWKEINSDKYAVIGHYCGCDYRD